MSVETASPVVTATPTKQAQQSATRKKKLLALNAEDQTSYEKKVKKLRKRGTISKKEPGVVYVGHLHREFTERQLRGYFAQFGKITRLRLSRSRKTGASRGFAFIEFDDAKDARIVAKTMDKYLIHQRLIKCVLMPKDKIHEQLFKGINQPWRFGAGYRAQRRKYNSSKLTLSDNALKKRSTKDAKLQEKLKSLGIDYAIPQGKEEEEKKEEKEEKLSPEKKKRKTVEKKKVVGPVRKTPSRRSKRTLPEAGAMDDEETPKKRK